MFCGKCGAEMPDGEKFCGKCGASLNETMPSVNESVFSNTSVENVKADKKKKSKVKIEKQVIDNSLVPAIAKNKALSLVFYLMFFIYVAFFFIPVFKTYSNNGRLGDYIESVQDKSYNMAQILVIYEKHAVNHKNVLTLDKDCPVCIDIVDSAVDGIINDSDFDDDLPSKEFIYLLIAAILFVIIGVPIIILIVYQKAIKNKLLFKASRITRCLFIPGVFIAYAGIMPLLAIIDETRYAYSKKNYGMEGYSFNIFDYPANLMYLVLDIIFVICFIVSLVQGSILKKKAKASNN